MAAQALGARTAAAASLTNSIREITRYKDNPARRKRQLQSKLDRLYKEKDELFSKHCFYADKASLDLQDEELLNWINPHMDTACDLIDAIEIIIEDLETEALTTQHTQDEVAETEAKEGEIKLAELQSASDETTLKDLVDAMMAVVDDVAKNSKDDAALVLSYLPQIEESLQNQIKSWNTLKSLDLPEAKVTELFTKQEEVRKYVNDNTVLATSFVKKTDPDAVISKSHSTASSTTETNDVSDSRLLKMEKAKYPTFSGDIRCYARFKTDFNDFVVPSNKDPKTQAYVLKQTCLKGDAKKLAENISDITEIWKRLDARFGDSIDLVSVVIKSVRDFRFGNTDHNQKLIKLVDELERGVEDLNTIDGKEHIANGYTVKLIEDKLPDVILTRWYQDPGSVKKINERFEEMLRFLKQERKQAERILLVQQTRPDKEKTPKDPFQKRGGNTANAAVGGPGSINPSNRCLLHPQADHLTRKCRKFLALDVEQRGKAVKDNDGCKLCLSKSHSGSGECPFAQQWGVCGVNNCQQKHSKLVHGCTISGIGCFASTTASVNTPCDTGETLLIIERIRTSDGTTIITFWDNGSTITLISRDYAQRNKLTGVPVSYDLTTVDGTTTIRHTTLYEIIIIDRKGNEHCIKALEIEEICGELKDIKTDMFAQLFNRTKASEIKRPRGKIDILIGSNYLSLHPTKRCSREGLVLFQSYFGTGKVLGGTHQNIQQRDIISSSARLCAAANISNIRVSKDLIGKPGLDFITTEGFGVEGPERCKKCTRIQESCNDCKQVHQMSRLERYELKQAHEALTLDPVTEVWTTEYPCRLDPNLLKENKPQAVSLTERTENRLKKDPLNAERYNEQFYDLLNREVLVEITDEEQQQFTGPSFFVSHHEVFKPESASTPLRIVINSSLRYHGVSPNDIWIKGTCALNSMWGILLRFREHKYALAGDMSKMYNQIRTTEKEKHMRKLLWRFMNTNDGFRTFGVNRVMFGDRPAAVITAVAISQTAEIHKSINEEAAEKIINDTYVDDVTTGTDVKENIPILKRDISAIMGKANIKMKGYAASGDTAPEALSLLGSGNVSRILGVNWDPTTDVFTVTVRINVSKKRRGARTEPDLAYDEIPRLLYMVLTRRICQGIVYSCYDIYGLVAPITIPMKIELRNLFSKELNLGWDDPVPEEVKKRWVEMLQIIKSVEHITFRRCIKPDSDVVGNPVLVMCNDASAVAMCATAHVRWELADGGYECFLYASKTRVAPLKKETIPRLEMQSAVLATRLRKSIATHSKLEFEKVVHVLDSKCTLATLHKDTVVLNEFMGNRVSETLTSTKVEEWTHIESKKNIADLATRTNARVTDVSIESDWQRGTPWMRLPMEEWPVSQDITGVQIPPEVLMRKAVVAAACSLDNIYDLKPFIGRSFTFVLRVTATVISILRSKCFTRRPEITANEIVDAEKACIKSSMHYTRPEFDAGKLRSLGAQVDEEGIINVVSRAAAEMEAHYGTDKFPILVYKDPLSYIWMQHIHNEDHSGITKTVSKSRRKFWIVRGRRLAEKIKRSCYRCRAVDKKLAEQKMAPLPTTRTKIAPTFHTTSMDMCGPVLIRDTVKQRTRKKVWIVIFTRALYIDLTEDYGTDSILQTLRRFICIRGCPGEIQSDQGSQLIAAAEDIAQLVANWDWEPIHQWASTNKIKWTLAPAEGQHQNGLSESLVKLTKRSLHHKISNNVLTFAQLQTVLFEIANVINSRPIGIVSGSDPSCPSPITPNHLILGRASADVPQGPFDHDKSKSITKRFRFLQDLVSQWWESWYQLVFPSLVPSYKWLQRHRNVKVGDICLIKYRKETRSTYRLGRVTEVKVGTDSLVRSVVLQYKLANETKFRTVSRPVQGVSVIVPIEEQSTLDPDAASFTPETN